MASTEPRNVVDHLRFGIAAGSRGTGPIGGSETPKPGDPAFARDEVIMLATARDALAAAERLSRDASVEPVIIGEALGGEARELGAAHAALALSSARGEGPGSPPCLLLSGGETTVTVTGGGRGGRNVEYLLGLALGLDGAEAVSAMAADTDGIDGTEDNAGAFVLPETLASLRPPASTPTRRSPPTTPTASSPPSATCW